MLWGLLCREQGYTEINENALEDLPREVQATLVKICLGNREEEDTWRSGKLDLLTDELPALSRIPVYPDFAEYEKFQYSIIAAAVDSSLRWHFLVSIQTIDGLYCAPAISAAQPLLRSPIAMSVKGGFVGTYVQFANQRLEYTENLVTRGESAILISPDLEREALSSSQHLILGKFFDVLAEIRGRFFNLDSERVNTSIQLYPNLRAALCVIESQIDSPTARSVFFQYDQKAGVLGDYRLFGPYENWSSNLKNLLSLDAPILNQLALLKTFDCDLRPQLSSLSCDKLSRIARAPILHALLERGYAPLAEDVVITIRSMGFTNFDFAERTAQIELAVEFRNSDGTFLPSKAQSSALSSDAALMVFQLSRWNLKSEHLPTIVHESFSMMNRANSSSLMMQFDLRPHKLLLGSDCYTDCLRLLASASPQSSPFFLPIQELINKKIQERYGFSVFPEWIGVRFYFDRARENRDNLDQFSHLIVRHLQGFSIFTIFRNKDSGILVFPVEDEFGSFVLRKNLPLNVAVSGEDSGNAVIRSIGQ